MTPPPELILASASPNHALIAARRQILTPRGITGGPDPVYDKIAARLTDTTGFPYGMVNFLLERQEFAGLANPSADSGLPSVGRHMDIRHGFCPHTADRMLGLPLGNVHASRLYSGNYVADAININAYIGVPLIFPGTDFALGTVCVIDQEVHSIEEADRTLVIVEQIADEVMKDIVQRPAA